MSQKEKQLQVLDQLTETLESIVEATRNGVSESLLNQLDREGLSDSVRKNLIRSVTEIVISSQNRVETLLDRALCEFRKLSTYDEREKAFGYKKFLTIEEVVIAGEAGWSLVCKDDDGSYVVCKEFRNEEYLEGARDDDSTIL